MQQLTLPFHLPGADWQEHEPYKSERGKTCLGRICVDGRILEYVAGSILAGVVEYRKVQP